MPYSSLNSFLDLQMTHSTYIRHSTYLGVGVSPSFNQSLNDWQTVHIAVSVSLRPAMG